MKKSIFAWSAVAVAAIATLSCQKEVNIKTPDIEEGVTINVIADNTVSKTAAVDGDTPSVQWTEGDKIKIFEIVDDKVGVNAESGSAEINSGKASFTATLSGSPQGESFKYSAVYPSSAVDQGGSGENKFYRILMPKDQTLKGNNFSGDSDLMFSTVLDHGDSRVANNESVQFSFRRLGTIVRLQLVGITAGEKIKKVTLTAPVNMAGRVKYDPVNGTISDAFYANASNIITLTGSDELVATGNDVVWFRVIAERDWGEENDKIGVEVETDQANYYRNGLDSEHALIDSPVIKFKDGGLTKFGFNLAAYRVAKPAATAYIKVNDASEISDGGEYLVTAFKDPKTYAMGSYTDANNPYYSYVEVTENEGAIEITSESVTIITLEDAGNGAFYIKVPGETSDQYLYWSSGNSVARADKGEADSFKWTVTPTSITNVGATDRKLQYNASSPRFACYTTNQTAIQLYADPTTITPVTPVPTNIITLEDVDDNNRIYLEAVDGVAYFTVTTDDDWTTNVNIENGDFSIDPENGAKGSQEIEVTADEDNEGAERQMGTITITCGNATAIVYVIQKAGASAKGTLENPYTVAEALDIISGLESKVKPAEQVYVSGLVSQVGSYNSQYHSLTYFLSDDGTTSDELQVYSGKYVNGANFTSASQLAANDQVVVYGYLYNYGGTPEIYQSSQIYSLNGKTKVLTLAAPTLAYDQANKKITVAWTAAEGSEGTVSYVVMCGDKSFGPVTEAGSHTFGMNDYGTYTVTVTASADDAVSAIVEATAILEDPGANNGDGLTPDTAFNMTGVKAYIETSGTDKVYVKGKISQIVSAFGANDYGNATFWISDDGSTNEFEAYRVMYLGNIKWETGDTDVAEGDEVILYGNVTKYGSTYETSSGNAYLYSLNGVKYPVITVSDISGVAATGVTNATTTVTFVDSEGWTASATPDGTVVTAASISGSTITYTVGANTGSLRTGKITVSLSKGSRTISAEISVSQLSGAGDSGPSDQSANYTGNIILSTEGGTSTSACKINIGENSYDGIKAGTSKIAGAVKVTVPTGAKYLHLHVAAWKGETVTLSVSPSGYSSDIALTSDSGIANNSPFTFSGDPSSTDYYKVITFSDALTADTELTFTATGGKRFVIWGVYAE